MIVPPEALPIFATAIKQLERRTPKEFRIFVIVSPEALPIFSTAIAPEDTHAIAGGEIVPSAMEDTRAIAGGKIVKCATEDTRG